MMTDAPARNFTPVHTLPATRSARWSRHHTPVRSTLIVGPQKAVIAASQRTVSWRFSNRAAGPQQVLRRQEMVSSPACAPAPFSHTCRR